MQKLINGKYAKEDNFSIVPANSNVWLGELPYKPGMKFPPQDVKDRADIDKTNYLLYKNSIDDIYSSFLSVIPEIDIVTGFRVKELISRLPYFRNNVENWVGIISSITPSIEFDTTEEVEQALSKVVSNSNINSIITDEIRARFLYGFSCYKISEYKGRAQVDSIPSKNVILFANKEHLGEIEVVLVFNIYKSKELGDVCEFVEYHDDGKIVKRSFKYSNGSLGREYKELYEEGKAFEKYDISPIVIMRHNAADNTDLYGCDTFRFWDSSIIGAMRALQNVFRVGEKVRELIRKVPSGALSKMQDTGAWMFVNKGNVSYNENSEKFPDIEYIQPNMEMIDAAIKVFETAMKSVSIDSGLGQVFFNLEKAGSNLSAKALESMMYPTKLKANLIKTETNEGLVELVQRICLLKTGELIDLGNIQVRWFDTLPRDVKEYTDAIMSRVNANIPTLSQSDAIILLDNVSTYTASKKAKELRGEKINSAISKIVDQNKLIDDSENQNVEQSTEELYVSEENNSDANVESHRENEGDNIDDNNLLWEYEKLPV